MQENLGGDAAGPADNRDILYCMMSCSSVKAVRRGGKGFAVTVCVSSQGTVTRAEALLSRKRPADGR